MATPTTARSASAGNKYSFMSFLDADGIMIGGTNTAPTAGTSLGMNRLLGIKEVPLTTPDSEVVQSTGDDGLIAEFDFDSIETRRYIATMAVDDIYLLSYLTGAAVESIADGDWIADDILDAPERNVCLIHQARAKRQDATNKGLKAWQGAVVNLATAKYLGRDTYNERSAGIYRLSVTPQLATYKPWGQTIVDGALVDASRFYKFRSQFPYTMQAFTGNNATPTFELDYKPVSVVKSLAVVERLARTISSIDNVAPYGFTLSANPANNARGVILYQFEG